MTAAAAYNVVLVKPPRAPFAMAFHDVGKLLYHSFQSLGLPCTFQVNRFEPAAVNVVLAEHLLDGPAPLEAHPSVVYQLEPLLDSVAWRKLDDRRLAILKAAREVWDYCPENVACLAERGLPGVKLLPLGFHEKMQTVTKVAPDIDVLFYGSVNARRKAVIDALARACRTKAVFGVYEGRRDQYVGRSRIVLNVHQYPGQVMEQVRVSYLLNNRCFVVSEDSPRNPYAGALVSVPYEELAACCLRYLGDDAGRERMAGAGFARLAERPMTAYLRAVLG